MITCRGNVGFERKKYSISSEDSTTNYAWEKEINSVLSTEDSTRTGSGNKEDFENKMGLRVLKGKEMKYSMCYLLKHSNRQGKWRGF